MPALLGGSRRARQLRSTVGIRLVDGSDLPSRERRFADRAATARPTARECVVAAAIRSWRRDLGCWRRQKPRDVSRDSGAQRSQCLRRQFLGQYQAHARDELVCATGGHSSSEHALLERNSETCNLEQRQSQWSGKLVCDEPAGGFRQVAAEAAEYGTGCLLGTLVRDARMACDVGDEGIGARAHRKVAMQPASPRVTA